MVLRWPKLFDGGVVTDLSNGEGPSDYSLGNGHGGGADYEFGCGVEFGSEGDGTGRGYGNDFGGGMGFA